jgi:hypothetical protein
MKRPAAEFKNLPGRFDKVRKVTVSGQWCLDWKGVYLARGGGSWQDEGETVSEHENPASTTRRRALMMIRHKNGTLFI